MRLLQSALSALCRCACYQKVELHYSTSNPYICLHFLRVKWGSFVNLSEIKTNFVEKSEKFPKLGISTFVFEKTCQINTVLLEKEVQNKIRQDWTSLNMASSIIESMSSRKLGYILTAASILLLLSFLVGGLISPTPNASMQYLATKCIDESAGQNTDKW